MGRILLSLLAIVAVVVVVQVSALQPEPKTADPYARFLAPASACPGADSTALPAAKQLRAMRCLLNWARVKKGLRPVSALPALDRAARLKATAIARCGEFTHEPCGEPFRRGFVEAGFGAGSSVYRMGENLGWGEAYEGAPRHILSGWLNSPAHRQNLFKPDWRFGGVAMLPLVRFQGAAQVELWVSSFGRYG